MTFLRIPDNSSSSRVLSPARSTARGVLLVIVMFLMLFPFINTLNEFLVRVIEPLVFLKPVQDVIIPYEVQIVRAILDIVGVPMTPGDPKAFSITIITKQALQIPIVVVWGCVGWQSLLIVIATLLTGLTGNFTFLSKLEVLVVGLIGTFLLNIGRISLIFIFYYFISPGFAMGFHDFGSVILTIAWLFILWWYSFTFVLVEKHAGETGI